MKRTLVLLWVLSSVFTSAEPSRAADTSVAIDVVNYTKWPVHAAGVALDEKTLYDKLGVPADTPLRIRKADGTAAPIRRGNEGGRAVVRVYLSLSAMSRLGLAVERAQRWEEANVGDATCDHQSGAGRISNGILAVTFGKKGWELGFQPLGEPAAGKLLIKDGGLDFWIDNQNRGRIMNSDPKDLGLARYADASFVRCELSRAGDDSLRFEIVRRMNGLAKAMTVTETFELVSGQPLLTCRVRWQNDGDEPLWVAYAGSGNGVYGKWAKDLLPGPLVERKKSPLLGDLNGGETRPGWLPQLCRISMESPESGCGFGMSTLLPMPNKVGQGSMIWGCGASGFQCNFIDPVQGQFPFLVKPHDALKNGFAFLTTQTGASVYRQTVELWQALQKGQTPPLPPPCAVFLDGEPLEAQTVAELPDRVDLLVDGKSGRQAALRIDFNKYYEGRLSAASPVEVIARPLATGKKPITLLKAAGASDHQFDLNKAFGKADELAFALEVKPEAPAALKALSIVETLPVAPEVPSPVPDAAVTDFAMMFRWRSIPLVYDYDLQLSRTADFADPIEVRITSSQDSPWYLPPEAKLPAPGTWHWRLRGVKGAVRGLWSPPRRFTVNADHGTRPVKRPLTPETPLFTLEATRVLDYTTFQPDIPADIAPYVGIIAEGFEGKGMAVTDFARGMEKLPHPIMLRSHWVSLADLEWLFQHVPNFVGIQGGEHLSSLYRDNKEGEMVYHHRLTRLCAKYGMFYQEADGTYKDDKWQELMDQQGPFIRQYGPWLVLSQKNNIIRRQFYSQSAAMGLWLGGVTYQHGAWEDGGFYWQNAGFKELGVCAGERTGVLKTMPRIFWSLVCVMGIGRGCSIYSLDGQTLMVSSKEVERGMGFPAGIWDNTGKTTDTFKRFVVPLIRATVKHRLVPGKAEVLKNVKLAVYNDRKAPGDGLAWPHYVEYGPLYAATYGFRKMGNIDGQLWEFFPNTGRYYFIPVLPQGNEPLGGGVRNLPVSQLQDTARVRELFDAAYPKWYEGEAFVCRVESTLTVQNSHENMDVTESFAVPLGGERFARLAGAVGPHSYLVGKIDDRRLWLQTNSEQAEREMSLSVNCPRKPQWTVEPPGAAKEVVWNERERRLEIRLTHQQGAVEVTVE